MADAHHHASMTGAHAPPRYDFLGAGHDRHARRTAIVLALCLLTMVAELAGGALFGSMALVADGLHMGTHAGVMLVAATAYRFARRRLGDPSFAFGTGKVGDLAAFASAVALAASALFIAAESVARLAAPVPIAFNEAIAVAVIGLVVNIASAWLLHDDHHHDDGEHGHGHGHYHGQNHHHDDHDHHHHVHQDHNIRAAYLHVLADAAVGILAIVGLTLGRLFGWLWLDPVMGLVGAVVIARWAAGLARAAGNVLLDRVPDPELAARARAILVEGGGTVADLHLWRVGPGHNALVATVSGGDDTDAARARLASLPTLSHVIVARAEDRG